ncbi:hypothetical protein, partial [Thauera sp. WH-1]|uniref:hypothetical protein n=1 Tax=Thauera sp. WH-1 TaxID=3398230 RepID=UPI0039FDBAE9
YGSDGARSTPPINDARFVRIRAAGNNYRVLTELEGKPLFLPREARMYPKQAAIEWRMAMLLR